MSDRKWAKFRCVLSNAKHAFVQAMLREWKEDESLAHIAQYILVAEVDSLTDQSYTLLLLTLLRPHTVRHITPSDLG
jgi:hypothetical protein